MAAPYDRKCEKSIVLSTFDLRPDDSGTKIIAALYTAAERGVQVQILIDGIYQKLFLEKSPVFQALAAHQNIEVGIYNPVTNLMRLNYRMHDKYLIIDESMYLLGGRNTNDIFLGDKKTRINVDRDILYMKRHKEKGNRCRHSRNILIPYGMKHRSGKRRKHMLHLMKKSIKANTIS